MTEVHINADDSPEEIDRKIGEAFSPLRAMLEAYERVFGTPAAASEEHNA